MPSRRVPVRLERAVARVKREADGDIWPDPAGLIDLPRSKAEFGRLRAAVTAVRRGRASSARPFLVAKRDGLTGPGHVIAPVERAYFQGLIDTFLHDIDARLESKMRVFGYRARQRRTSPTPYGRTTEQWWSGAQRSRLLPRQAGTCRRQH